MDALSRKLSQQTRISGPKLGRDSIQSGAIDLSMA